MHASQPFAFWAHSELVSVRCAGVYLRVVFFAVQRGFGWNRPLKNAVPDNGTFESR